MRLTLREQQFNNVGVVFCTVGIIEVSSHFKEIWGTWFNVRGKF